MKSTNLFFAVLALFIGSGIATPIATPGEFDAVYNYNDVKRKEAPGDYDASYRRLYKRQDAAPEFDAAYKSKVYSRQDFAPGFDKVYTYDEVKVSIIMNIGPFSVTSKRVPSPLALTPIAQSTTVPLAGR
ncbi:hypothetical protein K474DRAFT_1770196 [Panus rudis PR-1116 ss-1]|nr:hypothetical protein K474DRAFT_1770196 [Panus rudis PR-1116 ss-1]